MMKKEIEFIGLGREPRALVKKNGLDHVTTFHSCSFPLLIIPVFVSHS